MDTLVLFLATFKEEANSYEDKFAMDSYSDSYQAFSNSYDNLVEFIEDSIKEENIAIDGDAILEFLDSLPYEGESQEYIDELESFNDMIVGIIEDMCM